MEGGRIIHTDYPWMWYDEEQVNKNGSEITLGIEVKPCTVHYNGGVVNSKLGVGLIRSRETFGCGVFSADIMLPKGKNLWMSFWLVGSGKWPEHGEVDVMEGWTDKSGSYFRFGIPQPPYVVPSWDVTTNVHWADNGHKSCGSRRLPVCKILKNPSDNWFKYEVEWKPDSIVFKINGKVIRKYGKDVSRRLVGTRQHVVFDLWTKGEDYALYSPMRIKSFEFKPL